MSKLAISRKVPAQDRVAHVPRQNDDSLPLLVQGVKDYAVLMLDPQGRVATWNKWTQRVKGHGAEESICDQFSGFRGPEAVAASHSSGLKIATEQGRFEEEGWCLQEDGSRFCANVVITALRDETGILRGFAKVTRDVTARKQAQQALRESEEKFRLLVQGVKDYAILMLDPQGQVTTWNEGAENIKGYRAEEIIGEHFSMFYEPEEVAAGRPSLGLKMAREKGRFEEEGWRVRKDGSRFWASVVITALRDEKGQLRGFGKVTRDITERMQTETKLRLLTERMSLAIGVAGVGVWEWDLASRTVTWDDTMFEIYGLPSVEPMPYETWTAAIHTDDLPTVEATLRNVINEKSLGTLEFRILRTDGSLRNITAVCRVAFDERSKLTRVIGVSTDVTERAQTEAALRKSHAQMTYTAHHDFLTGLPNRALLLDRVNQAIALADRYATKVAVMFLDVDGFKKINDSLGHATGDRILQSIAHRLSGCIRASDTVSRQGGDEFVVLLSEVKKPEDPAITARRIIRAMSKVHSIDEHDLHVTASVGVSIYPDDGLDADTLIKNADTAMYQAKQNGRHGYQFFQRDMKTPVAKHA